MRGQIMQLMAFFFAVTCSIAVRAVSAQDSAATTGSVATAVPQYREAVGIVRPQGEPLEHDKSEALAGTLRSILASEIDQRLQNSSAQRLAKAAIEKMDLAGLGRLFAGQTVVYEKSRRGYYEVKVRAELLPRALDAWAAGFAEEPPIKKLRVMIVIPEQHLRRPIPDPAGETEMINKFVSEGFRVLDQQQVATIRNKDMVKRAAKGNADELIAIAQGWGAELLLVGEAFSEDVPRDPSLVGNAFPCRARVEARIYLCDTAEILSAGDGEAGAVDPAAAVAAKAALREAATKLADKIIADLVVKKLAAHARRSVKVILAGADFEQHLQFKELLEGLTGMVSGVDGTAFAESRAEMDVTTSATSAKLAEAVFLQARKLGMKLKVVEQSNRRCVFQVVPAGAEAPAK